MKEGKSESAIRAENLSVGYGSSTLISGIDFDISEGEIVTLIGPNGSGKSTILKTLTNQLKKRGGRIAVMGRDTAFLKESDMAKTISMVTTERIHPELMTCAEVIATGRYPYTGRLGILSKKDWDEVRKAAEKVHATDILDKDFMKTSDGQKQRVMLARAICQDTPIIVLDEPTSFLDMFYKIDILKTVWNLAKTEGKSIIMSLHELDLARAVSDRIICVDGAKIRKIGTVDEIFSGGFIQNLYGLKKEEFDEKTGTMKVAFGNA